MGWEESIGHSGGGIRFSSKNGELSHHGFLGSKLSFAAEGHQHRARSNGGIKPLHQAVLAADLQSGHVLQEGLLTGPPS